MTKPLCKDCVWIEDIQKAIRKPDGVYCKHPDNIDAVNGVAIWILARTMRALDGSCHDGKLFEAKMKECIL